MRHLLISSVALIAAVLLASLHIIQNKPPEVLDKTSPDTVFSGERAFEHVRQIAKAPHSIGTHEHEKVRAYLLERCKTYGLTCEVQETTSCRSFGWFVQAGKVHNIVGHLKGKGHKKKSIILMAHYDSQPNTLGAADDGAGVAALLETARILHLSRRLKNDIVFLFTDGEENKLLGAHAYLKGHADPKDIGLVINLEGRGTRGVSTMFETSPNNGWLIAGYARAVRHPMGSSLLYEIYKKLPNDTDYTIFKDAGISGLNHAFIDGFVNYHTMTDSPENLDPKSLQDHGENMLSLVKYFGDVSLVDTSATDVTYFSIWPNLFVYYPGELNIGIIIVAIVLMGGLIFVTVSNGTFNLKGFGVGVLILPTAVLFSFLITKYFRIILLSHHPSYNNFNGSAPPHVNYYFVAISCLAILCISSILLAGAKIFDRRSLITGMLTCITLMTFTWWIAAPTAMYILGFPLLFVLTSQFVVTVKRFRTPDNLIQLHVIALVGSMPSLLLLPPVLHLLFMAFGLSSNISFTTIVWGVTIGLLLPLLMAFPKYYNIFLLGCVIVIFSSSLFMGEHSAALLNNHPFPTQLKYVLNSDTGSAAWSTSKIDEGNKQFFPNPNYHDDGETTNVAPNMNLAAAAVNIVSDSITTNKRRVVVHVLPSRKESTLSIWFSENSGINDMRIEGQQIERLEPGRQIFGFNYLGATNRGILLQLELPPSNVTGIIEESSIGLTALPFFSGYATGTIPAPGFNSNIIVVKKAFTL